MFTLKSADNQAIAPRYESGPRSAAIKERIKNSLEYVNKISSKYVDSSLI